MTITVEYDRRRNRWTAWSDSDLLDEEVEMIRAAGFVEFVEMGAEPEFVCVGEPDFGLLPVPYRVLN